MCKNAKIVTLIFRRMSCRPDIAKRRRLVRGQAQVSVLNADYLTVFILIIDEICGKIFSITVRKKGGNYG